MRCFARSAAGLLCALTLAIGCVRELPQDKADALDATDDAIVATDDTLDGGDVTSDGDAAAGRVGGGADGGADGEAPHGSEDGHFADPPGDVKQTRAQHFYPSLQAGHDDGLVIYFPLNEAAGSTAQNQVSHTGETCTHGGTWKDADTMHGPLLLLDQDQSLNPKDPTASSMVYTILAVLPGRKKFTGFASQKDGIMYFHSKQQLSQAYAQTYGFVAFPASIDCGGSTTEFCARAMTNGDGSGVATLLLESQDAEETSGVVYAFFQFDGTTYTIRVRDRIATSTAKTPNGKNSDALHIGAYCDGKCTTKVAALYSWAMWDRLLTQQEMDAIIKTDRELVAGW